MQRLKLGVALLLTLVTANRIALAGKVDLPRMPSISPDGATIAFSWRGDLWTVATTGGTAHRLTSHPGDDLGSTWSADGAQLAFESTRGGQKNLWLIEADGSGLHRLTDIDRPCAVSGFDGGYVLFNANCEADVYRDHRPYRVPVSGGDIERVHDAFGSHPVADVTGTRVLFSRAGYYDGWTRRHYRGSEAQNIWLYDRQAATFRQLTSRNGNDGKARWAALDAAIFMSDREDRCVNLYRMSATGDDATVVRLTPYTDRDVLDFDVARDGRTAVFVRWDTLYSLDLTVAGAAPVPLDVSAPQDTIDPYALRDVSSDVTEAALSPDGKSCAVVAFGEIFVRHVDENRPTRRVTHTPTAREKDLAWSPDGVTLYFTSDRDGTESIYSARVTLTRSDIRAPFVPEPAPEEEREEEEEEGEEGAEGAEGADEPEAETDDDAPDPTDWHDAVQFAIAPVVQRETNDRMPVPAPDGRHVAFRGTRGDVHVLDIASGDIRTLIESWDNWITFDWSPDSLHLAITRQDLNFNSDIWIARTDGESPAVNISRHPDDDRSPTWSADGRILSFVSDRMNDEFDVWAVYLDADLEAMQGVDREQYYKRTAEAAGKRTPPAAPHDDDDDDDDDDEKSDVEAALDLEDAYLRVRRITTMEGNEDDQAITPSGEHMVFTVSEGDAAGLYVVKWDGSELKKLGAAAALQGISLTGDRAVVVAGGTASSYALPDGKQTALGIQGRLRVDHAALASQKLREAARGLGEQYYHPTMNGTDWAKLTSEYDDLAQRTRTVHEFTEVGSRLIGELNGSHLGIRMAAPTMPLRETHGHLGILTARVAAGYEVIEVIPHGPAATGPMHLVAGDVLESIEFEPFDAARTLSTALRGRAGRETIVTISRRGNDEPLHLLMTPVDYTALRTLRYDAWRARNAALVDEWSGGRLGYIHIQGMNQPSLDVFERDLFAAADGKEGLVLDVRNNGGGWTADRVLASIMVTPHAWTVPRGVDWSVTGHYPQPRLYIQRYTMPMNLLCNEKSYSNAEIMSHAFKTLKRGTLVGQTTHGSVISTGGWALLDGTFVRLPFRGWFVADETGRDMELNGAVPDLIVPQTPDDEAKGDDRQLRTAVEDLVGRL